jgi:ribosomal protein S20
MDKAVTKGVFHKNKAARLKSRLTKQANKLSSATSSS